MGRQHDRNLLSEIASQTKQFPTQKRIFFPQKEGISVGATLKWIVHRVQVPYSTLHLPHLSTVEGGDEMWQVRIHAILKTKAPLVAGGIVPSSSLMTCINDEDDDVDVITQK